MTRADVDALALVIAAHWPHPALTDFDLDAMHEALEAVPGHDVARVVQRLVTNGREYQPRSPAILAALADMDAEERVMRRGIEAGERANQRDLEAANATPCPPEVLDRLRRVRRVPSQ